MVNNYRLLVSGIAPRPIAFISTVVSDGTTKIYRHLATSRSLTMILQCLWWASRRDQVELKIPTAI
jgi:hypothetical protein